jgi:hypothetical protein
MPISYAAALQTHDITNAQYGVMRNGVRQALTGDGFLTGERRRWR